MYTLAKGILTICIRCLLLILKLLIKSQRTYCHTGKKSTILVWWGIRFPVWTRIYSYLYKKSFVRPPIKYFSVIWSSIVKKDITVIESFSSCYKDGHSTWLKEIPFEGWAHYRKSWTKIPVQIKQNKKNVCCLDLINTDLVTEWNSVFSKSTAIIRRASFSSVRVSWRPRPLPFSEHLGRGKNREDARHTHGHARCEYVASTQQLGDRFCVYRTLRRW